MRSRRVLVDGRPLRARPSGVGQYVWHLSAELATRLPPDCEMEVLVFGRPDPSGSGGSTSGPPPGVSLHDVQPVPRKVFNGVAAYAPVVPAAAFGLRADLVHATYFEKLPWLPPQTRVVSTIHDVAFLRHPEVFSANNLAASRRALRWQLRRSHKILTPSEFTRAELVDLCGVDPARVVVTPLAVTEPVAGGPGDAASRDDPRPLRDRPFVLYLGNLEPRKNLLRLLDAWEVGRARRTHDLVLAGTTLPHASALRSRLRLSAQSVVPLGFVSAQAKHALLRRCSAFVYPSLYEGFGIPVLEAMAAGAPIVTSQAGALTELTGDAALSVPATDVAALSEAVQRVLDDDDLRHGLARAGLGRARAFCWKRTATLTSQVYGEVLA